MITNPPGGIGFNLILPYPECVLFTMPDGLAHSTAHHSLMSPACGLTALLGMIRINPTSHPPPSTPPLQGSRQGVCGAKRDGLPRFSRKSFLDARSVKSMPTMCKTFMLERCIWPIWAILFWSGSAPWAISTLIFSAF